MSDVLYRHEILASGVDEHAASHQDMRDNSDSEPKASSHSTVVVPKDNTLNFALNKIQTALNEASDERYQSLKEWQRLAHRWENEGDTHGMNFHQGMVAGANYVDIYYRRIGREIDAIRAAAYPTTQANDDCKITTAPDHGPTHWMAVPAPPEQPNKETK